MEQGNKKRGIGKRGNAKPSDVISIKTTNGKFSVPRPVCRELGVSEGGTLEFHRHPLENGTVEYILRSDSRCDIFTKETDGMLIEYQGITVSEKSIIELAKKIGILSQDSTD